MFKSYNETGSYVIEEYVSRAIENVYRKMTVTENLPSTGRVRVRESDGGEFIALHLLYAPPVNRGNVCLLPDFPKLYDTSVTIKVDRKITSVTAMPEGISVPFSQNGDSVKIDVPPFKLHTLLVLK